MWCELEFTLKFKESLFCMCMHTCMVRRENTTSAEHAEQQTQRQYRGPRAWDDFRDYYQQFQDNMQRRKAKQQREQSTKKDDGGSRFEKFIEMLHRSTAYRPSTPLFIPIAALVTVIYGSISCALCLLYFYRTYR